MLKQKPLISSKKSEQLIYDMVKYSDHAHAKTKNLSKDNIKKWFEDNKYSWKNLVEETRHERL